MRVLSVQIGMPQEVAWHGRVVRTSIFKQPVAGRVRVRRLNLDGDAQADLTVHGGAAKAVYAYASEHYPAWRQELDLPDLPWGAFGENLTLEGLIEADVAIGDRLRIGTAEFVVTQPRQPCYKLALRFDRLDIGKLFMASGRSGFYLAVLEEGTLAAGDAVEHLPGPSPASRSKTAESCRGGRP
jgi:MOSC domain-containing protein YiiM